MDVLKRFAEWLAPNQRVSRRRSCAIVAGVGVSSVTVTLPIEINSSRVKRFESCCLVTC